MKKEEKSVEEKIEKKQQVELSFCDFLDLLTAVMFGGLAVLSALLFKHFEIKIETNVDVLFAIAITMSIYGLANFAWVLFMGFIRRDLRNLAPFSGSSTGILFFSVLGMIFTSLGIFVCWGLYVLGGNILDATVLIYLPVSTFVIFCLVGLLGEYTISDEKEIQEEVEEEIEVEEVPEETGSVK